MGGISSWPEFNARYTPASPAILFEGASETWADFEGAVGRIAGGLRHHGVGKGDRVGILAHNHPGYLHAVFGIARLGAIVVPFNTRLTHAELRFQVEHTAVSWLFHDDAFTGAAAELAELVPVERTTRIDGDGDSIDELTSHGTVHTAEDVARDDPVAILFTSGTTGHPKGAVLTHANVMAVAEASARCDDVRSDDRVLIAVPLAFAGPLLPTAMPMIASGAGILLARAAEVDQIFDFIEHDGVTMLSQVPLVYAKMAQHPRFGTAKLDGLRVARSGGSPIPESLIATWHARGIALVGSYGLTEASGLTLQLPVGEARRKIGYAGIPVLHHRVRIRAEDGSECGAGETGELLIQGPTVMSHYLHDAEATDAAFDGNWLKTGDLAQRDDEGFVKIVDRKKDMLISGGLNVYPAEIERVLAGHPAVLEVAVVATRDDKFGERPVAVVVTDHPELSLDDLSSVLSDLADYKRPVRIEIVPELPRTMSGKVMRHVLNEQFYDNGHVR
ncbi:class I adenylate-forming enzyme family protein [Actinomadura sp. 1N219]|uniref:class I adenylate-forming enzyme family protein n=1 Tax=Actinomadura sp. 1N219 TaxID=3375152 RepID=UPI0037A090E3